MKQETIKIHNTEFNIASCASMSKQEFIAQFSGLGPINLSAAYDKIKSMASGTKVTKETPAENGNSGSTFQENTEAKGKSVDAGNTKKPRDKSQDN